jgi:hypothetical protein
MQEGEREIAEKRTAGSMRSVLTTEAVSQWDKVLAGTGGED